MRSFNQRLLGALGLSTDATCAMAKQVVSRAMSQIKVAILVPCLFTTLLPACSRFEPSPREFILVGQRPAKALESGNTLPTAKYLCDLEARQKSIGSLAAIFSRVGGRGSADEVFIACMKKRGYEPVQ
jgi:hypothetical protein